MGLTIFRGYYDMNNYTSGKALTLHNTSMIFSCTIHLSPSFSYEYRPLSDNASFYDFNAQRVVGNVTTSLSFSVAGFWTGGAGTSTRATFNTFPNGVYTSLAGDECTFTK
jgi:hypothetical protein